MRELETAKLLEFGDEPESTSSLLLSTYNQWKGNFPFRKISWHQHMQEHISEQFPHLMKDYMQWYANKIVNGN